MIDDIDDSAMLDWIEQRHTLHNAVEFLYVVDGYQVEVTQRDGNMRSTPLHGATLRKAIRKAMESGL